MLEHLPTAIGAALKGVRPGLDKLTLIQHFAGIPQAILVESRAFQADAPLPIDATEDGRKLSPPLAWQGVPPGAAAIVIVIEDADSPTPEPLVHLIVLGLPGQDGRLAEGELKNAGTGDRAHALGLNSYLKAAYLPPDPPSGHGPHRYAVPGVRARHAPFARRRTRPRCRGRGHDRTRDGDGIADRHL